MQAQPKMGSSIRINYFPIYSRFITSDVGDSERDRFLCNMNSEGIWAYGTLGSTRGFVPGTLFYYIIGLIQFKSQISKQYLSFKLVNYNIKDAY